MLRFGMRVSASALAMATVLGGGTAFAQSATTEQASQGAGEIVVTAQKREQRLQDVPIAISVLNADQVAAANNIEAVFTQVPSLSFSKGGTSLNSVLFLRGVGTSNFSIAAEPSVSFVLDGVVLARSGESFGDLYDVERLEVLRGPQGTLFGKNASAGVINVVSKMPGDAYAAQVEVSAFEDEEYKVKGSIDAPLSDTFRTRLTAFVGEFDGNVRNVFNGKDLNGYDRWGVRGIAVWDASEALRLTFIGDYRDASDECCTQIIGAAPSGANGPALTALLSGVQFGLDSRTVAHNRITQTEETSWGGSVQADYSIGDFVLTSITAYRGWDNNEIREGDWLPRGAAYVGNAFNQVHDGGPQESTTFTQEIRLTSPDTGPLSYVLGAYYYKAEADRTFRRDVLNCLSSTLPADATGLQPCTTTASVIRSDAASATFGSVFDNFAVFADGSYDITDRLTFLAGLRYTQDELDIYHNRTLLASIPLPGISNNPTNLRRSAEETNVSGRAGLQYKVSDDFTTYATYSRGYKGPAYNVFFQMNANPAVDQANLIAAETADSYEGGVKANMADGRAIINAAFFYATYDNFQANSPDNQGTPTAPIFVSRLTNAGEISTRGLEVDWLFRPTDNLTINGGLAFTDAQIEKYRNPVGLLTADRKGEQLPFAPKTKGSFGANYRWEPGFAPVAVTFNGAYSFTAKQFTNIDANPANPRFIIPSYDKLDASIAIGDLNDRYVLTLIGNNLLDESFATLAEGGGPSNLLYRVPREADRYFGISLKAKFGG